MTDRTEISRLRHQGYGEPRRSAISNQLGIGYGFERDQRSASGSVEPPARREIKGQRSEVRGQRSDSAQSLPAAAGPPSPKVALLTGGDDKPYVLGLTTALTSAGICLDVIGSDDLNVAELLDNPGVNFLNLRGDQRPHAPAVAKAIRLSKYYFRLIRYAAVARPKLLHILWNNKFEFFDRTLLLLYYKLLGKRLVFTAHNVNARKRDCTDTWLNRFSLRIQYQLVDHIFVHTERMKSELVAEFGVARDKVSVIPFGINNTVPNSVMTTVDAKRMLGIRSSDKAMLCFGQIARYKGLEYLITAFTEVLKENGHYRLIIAGKPKWSEAYWNKIEQLMIDNRVRDRVIERIEHVPDEQTELYFKAADVLVLPYTHVFQSGVLFLGYSFGLPAIAADVGNLKDEIIQGETGFVFKSRDASDLARKIDNYFNGELFHNLETRRAQIKKYANERYSWSKVASITAAVYSDLLRSTEVRGQTTKVRGQKSDGI
jgi:D-inositol-3-phosphate glycosyltransferase